MNKADHESAQSELKPDWRWFDEGFEPVRPEALTDLGRSLYVCKLCGGPVFRYAAAWHLRWHREVSG